MLGEVTATKKASQKALMIGSLIALRLDDGDDKQALYQALRVVRLILDRRMGKESIGIIGEAFKGYRMLQTAQSQLK